MTRNHLRTPITTVMPAAAMRVANAAVERGRDMRRGVVKEWWGKEIWGTD